jgi:hypothetical protein
MEMIIRNFCRVPARKFQKIDLETYPKVNHKLANDLR